MKKLNLTGYFLTLLFPVMLFLSYKGEQTLSYLIMLIFLLSMLFRKNRTALKTLVDGKIAIGLLIFILSPFIISLLSGGIVSRVDSNHYLYWLIFFPLVFYIDNENKLWNFIKAFLAGGTISLIITLVIFIKNYVRNLGQHLFLLNIVSMLSYCLSLQDKKIFLNTVFAINQLNFFSLFHQRQYR